MLIFLRGGISENTSNTAFAGLENLARAGICGHHLIAGDRSALESVSKAERLSLEARAFYRRMALHITQIGQFIRSFDRINVEISDGSVFVINGVVPAGMFSNPDYCEKAQLLVENLTDYHVMMAFAHIYLARIAGGVGISVRALNGGGSTTHQTLEYLDSIPGGPVLCIVDSDRKYFGAALGSTSLTAQRKFRGCRSKWRFRFYVLLARELENLIPVSIRKAACAVLSDKVRQEVVALEGMAEKYSMYCCLKGGDSTCRMLGDVLSKKQYHLIKEIGEMRAPGLPSHIQCGTCPYDGGCITSPGLGSLFLQRVSSLLTEGASCDPKEWSKELGKVVDLVVQMGVASPVYRA